MAASSSGYFNERSYNSVRLFWGEPVKSELLKSTDNEVAEYLYALFHFDSHKNLQSTAIE